MLKRTAAFVAIVWAVAGTFVLTELLALRGMDVLLDYPMFDGWILSDATEQSTSCEASGGPAAEASPLSPVEVRTAVWFLGLSTGRDAVVRNWETPTPETEALVRDLEADARQIAGFLGVPPPDPFVADRLAEAYREFGAYIESSSRATALALAREHGTDACTLYKLAAFWAYSTFVRAAVPGERGQFALEIRHHAQRLNLPSHLWAPLTTRSSADQTPDAIQMEVQALTAAMLAHLQRTD